MQHNVLIGLTAIALMTGPAPSPAGDSQEPMLSAATRDVSDRESRRTFELIFAGQSGTGLAYLDSLEAFCKNEPLYLLLRARLNREFLPVDNDRKETIVDRAAPVYADLDRVIDVCTQRIDAGDTNPQLYLYRGWAWMLKSHIRTFERSMWSAGRDAKKGKSDLETYLEREPTDPIATGIMGAFLYFADTLPAAYKFVSKLLFLPGGDRDGGLDMMEMSQGRNSITDVDNRLILYSVYIGFEGRFEDGMDGFDYLTREYPLHATFMRPAGVLQSLMPRYTSADRALMSERIERIEAIPTAQTEQATRWLLHFERACSDRIRNPQLAVAGFEYLIERRPENPDWLHGFAAFELGRLKASMGQWDDASRLFQLVVNDESAGAVKDQANEMTKELASSPSPTLGDPARIPRIYEGNPESAAQVAREITAGSPVHAIELFYLGEALYGAGDIPGAIDAYARAMNGTGPKWDDAYRLLAGTRAGELAAMSGDAIAAADYYSLAQKFWRREFLYDWLMAGRERYFRRLATGQENPPYQWFAARQGL